MKIDESHPFPLGYPFHSLGIVQMGLDDFSFRVEVAPVGRRYQHGDSSFFADSVDEGFQLSREEVICSPAGTRIDFLVVMAEFHKHVVSVL